MLPPSNQIEKNGAVAESFCEPAARLIAFYLPQFHPIPENDLWWGKGFTEWTNVAKAKPLFRGHHQPNLPGELGFYDLRVPETRAAQAELARNHGIEGFCYWHYWFAGKRLLERPFNEVLQSGEPDFPFCVAWANQTWSGVWHGAPNRILQLQSYPGPEDHAAHFYSLLPAFTDDRYIRVDGKPLFAIYAPCELPDIQRTMDLWRDLAHREGLGGLHLVGIEHQGNLGGNTPAHFGFDAIAISNQTNIMRPQFNSSRWGTLSRLRARIVRKCFPRPRHIYSYKDAMPYFLDSKLGEIDYYPSVVTNWDNTPRSGLKGIVLTDSTPELFRVHVDQVLAMVRHKPLERRLIFIKSWNEWAEGNYLEPDLRFGRGSLEALKTSLSSQPFRSPVKVVQ